MSIKAVFVECEYVINGENIEYVKGLNSKVKLGLYKAFRKLNSKGTSMGLVMLELV